MAGEVRKENLLLLSNFIAMRQLVVPNRHWVCLPNVSGNAGQMKYRNLIILLLAVGIFSCSDSKSVKYNSDKNSSNQSEKHFYMTIKNGIGYGFLYSDFMRHRYFCRNHTTTITNNGIAPVHLELSLSNKYYYIDSKDSLKSKVFLLPREVTPKSQDFASLTIKELKRFLDNNIDASSSLDKIINPKESCVVTFGVLVEIGYASVSEIALVSKENSSTLSLDLKLDRHLKTSSPLIIPCGQITFMK